MGRVTVALLVAAAGFLVAGPAAGACASEHLALRWSGFRAPVKDFAYPFFYFTEEKAGTTPIQIMAVGDDCTEPTPARPWVRGRYRVVQPTPGTPRAATATTDFAPVEGETGPLYGINHGPDPSYRDDVVTIQQDVAPEAVAEVARAEIVESSMSFGDPSEVPLYIIDDDGLSRAAMETTGPVERSETYADVVIAVFRAGPATETDVFEYTVAGAGTNPATPGEDFQAPAP